jgi:hypothetical protein
VKQNRSVARKASSGPPPHLAHHAAAQ